MTTEYPHSEEIIAILKDKADFVKQNGLNYLIPNWKIFTYNYAGNEESIDEWLNELDGRKIIDEILNILSDSDKIKITEILKEIDSKFIDQTFEINECAWNEKVEKDNQYNRQKNWYYYRMNQNVFDNEVKQYSKR